MAAHDLLRPLTPIPWTAVSRAASALSVAALLSGCQLLIDETGVGGGQASTSTTGATSTSTGASTGAGACDEKSAFLPPASDVCGDGSQCSGFCSAFQSTCGNGFTDFKTVCCKACDAITPKASGEPFCCRERLLQAAEVDPNVCSSVALGDGTQQCAGPQRNFCAVVLAACDNITEQQCTSAKSDVSTKCLAPAFKSLADAGQCDSLATCIANAN